MTSLILPQANAVARTYGPDLGPRIMAALDATAVTFSLARDRGARWDLWTFATLPDALDLAERDVADAVEAEEIAAHVQPRLDLAERDVADEAEEIAAQIDAIWDNPGPSERPYR